MPTMRRAFPIVAMAGLAACQPAPAPEASAPPVDRQVLAFAQGACGGCHAVEANALSPNPEAPEWPLIVNRSGLNEETLTTWLVDAHNYPEEMDFDLDAPQVEDLVAYMLTMQSEDYEPPIM